MEMNNLKLMICRMNKNIGFEGGRMNVEEGYECVCK